MTKNVIYDQVRVNGGSNYELPGQRWVPKLVVYKYLIKMFLFCKIRDLHIIDVFDVLKTRF